MHSHLHTVRWLVCLLTSMSFLYPVLTGFTRHTQNTNSVLLLLLWVQIQSVSMLLLCTPAIHTHHKLTAVPNQAVLMAGVLSSQRKNDRAAGKVMQAARYCQNNMAPISASLLL